MFVIGMCNCFCPSWLVSMITLVLVLRQVQLKTGLTLHFGFTKRGGLERVEQFSVVREVVGRKIFLPPHPSRLTHCFLLNPILLVVSSSQPSIVSYRNPRQNGSLNDPKHLKGKYSKEYPAKLYKNVNKSVFIDILCCRLVAFLIVLILLVTV